MRLVYRVRVPDKLCEEADRLGREIALARRECEHRNNLRTPLSESIRMTVKGTRGEAAFYWFCGGKKNGAWWDREVRAELRGEKFPDVKFGGHDYDAKAIEEDELALLCYPEGVFDDWRYVLVGLEQWPFAVMLGWCTGPELRSVGLKDKVRGRAAYFLEQNNPLLKSCVAIRPDLEKGFYLDGFILQDRDGDYVKEVESTGWETVKTHFVFTKERKEARVFSHQDLFWKQATNPVGIQFTCGFAGGRVIRTSELDAAG